MGPLDTLRHEHHVIVSVLDRMERAVHGPAPAYDATALLSACLAFLRAYLEDNHHSKEENVLFPLMHKDPLLASMAQTLQEDHLGGFRVMNQLQAALGGSKCDDTVRRLISEFSENLRWHIAREDNMIFQDVEARLSASDAVSLQRGFAAIEERALGNSRLEHLMAAITAHSCVS